MISNPYVNDILQWRDSLSRMPDHHFFELLRMYLGDIKTPYNKQKLIEQLSAFLRHEENKKNIARLLSPVDILILATIDALPDPTQDMLIQFLGSDFSIAELCERLMNLEERLLVFRVYKGNLALTFKVNPLLRSVINPLLTDEVLIPSVVKVIPDLKQAQVSRLSPSLLAAWVSFTFQIGDLCKASGMFKKKTVSLIKNIFPQIQDPDYFLFLTKALLNLQLFKNSDGLYKPNIKKLRTFASMNEEAQASYICATAGGRCSRDMLHVKAQLVCDILSCMGERLFTKSALIRTGYLELQKKGSPFVIQNKSGRFSTMLEKKNIVALELQKESNNASQLENSSKSIEKLISAMHVFGLLECVGKTESGNNVFRCASWVRVLQESSVPESKVLPGSIVINAGFSVTILRTLSFSRLLDIIQCMDIERLDGIAEYKITRNSCMRFFDTGKKPSDITTILLPTLAHEIPQNLQFLLNDWYQNYCSASLYKGYVLRINPDKQVAIKNIPEISKRIREELAPGVYLIDFLSDEEAADIIGKAGLDFVGAVKKMHSEVSSVPYPLVAFPTQNAITHTAKTTKVATVFSASEEAGFLNSLKKELEDCDFEREQVDGLLSRINRKIIVNSKQLRAESVRPEKNEAYGMDFLGKIHVVEHGILSKSFLKIIVNEFAAIKGETEFLGLPLSLIKKDDDVFLRLQLEISDEIVTLSIGKAQSVKRIRGAIFKERKY